MTLTKAAEEAKARGCSVFILKEDGGSEFMMRTPAKAELMLFQDNVARGSGSMAASQEKFVRTLFVGDNVEEFDTCLNKRPLVAGRLFDQLMDDLGLNANFTKTQI